VDLKLQAQKLFNIFSKLNDNWRVGINPNTQKILLHIGLNNIGGNNFKQPPVRSSKKNCILASNITLKAIPDRGRLND